MPSPSSGWTMNNPCAPRRTSPRRRRKWHRTPRRALPPATGFSMRGFFEASGFTPRKLRGRFTADRSREREGRYVFTPRADASTLFSVCPPGGALTIDTGPGEGESSRLRGLLLLLLHTGFLI